MRTRPGGGSVVCRIQEDLTLVVRGVEGSPKSFAIYTKYRTGSVGVTAYHCDHAHLTDAGTSGCRSDSRYGFFLQPEQCAAFDLHASYEEGIALGTAALRIPLRLCRGVDGPSLTLR